MPSRTIRAILLGGIVAGTLDIADAFLFFGIRNHAAPQRILQSIARGLLGAPAFQGGWKTAALGLVLHFVIATAAAAAYCLASRKAPLLVRRPVLFGMLYGVIWYVFMNYVVLPLSAVPKSTARPQALVLFNGVAAIVFCVGLPIALIARRFSRKA